MRHLVIMLAAAVLLTGCSVITPVSTIDTSDPNVIRYTGPKTESAELTKPDGTVVKFDRAGEPLLDKAIAVKALLSVGDEK